MKYKYKGEVFILNKPFEGSYADGEGKVAHEIIDYFKADDNSIYIYNNPLGHCPKNIGVVDENKEYSIKYMLLAKRATMNEKDKEKSSRFELTHKIKIKRCLHHESTSNDKQKLDNAQQKIKDIIKHDKIRYGGKLLYEIYGADDKSLYVTFEVDKIYEAKKPIPVVTPGYRFQRNKGYVFLIITMTIIELLMQLANKLITKNFGQILLIN